MAVKMKVEPDTLKAPALKAGDTVALICPAGRPENIAVLERARRVIEEMGFQAAVGKNALNIHGYMAGTDVDRAADFNRAVTQEHIAGIFCVTGGYGSLQLLPHINYEALRARPKVIVGCDDNTSLLNAITAVTGLVTWHGPNLDQIKTRFTFERLKKAVTEGGTMLTVTTGDALKEDVGAGDLYCSVPGQAEGKLLGGNLTALVSLLGTPYEPIFSERIFFLEDKNEQSGILDRWLTTLYIGGQLGSCSAVALGYFEGCDTRHAYNMLSVVDTFSDRLKMLAKPSCFGFPIGQGKDTCTIPIGINARIDCQQGSIEMLESGLV